MNEDDSRPTQIRALLDDARTLMRELQDDIGEPDVPNWFRLDLAVKYANRSLQYMEKVQWTN